MAVTVTFYRLKKRTNSTMRPAGNSDGEFQAAVNFGEPVNQITPHLIIDMSSLPADFHTAFNYCYIPNFIRFYFVTSRTVMNEKTLRVDLAVDVLATYKTEIGDSTQLMIRSAANPNYDMIENLYGSEPAIIERRSSVLHNYANDIDNGLFIVGIIAATASSFGAVTYYVLTPSGFATLLDMLLRNDRWTAAIPELSPTLAKGVVNPMQYITSCEWFPLKFNYVLSQIDHIGWFEIDPIPAGILPNNYITAPKLYTLTKPKHPDNTGPETNFLNHSEYGKIFLTAAPFGEIEIDPDLIYNVVNIELLLLVDYVTGMATLRIEGLDQTAGVISIGTVIEKISIPVALAQVINGGVVEAAGGNVPISTSPLGLASNIVGKYGSTLEAGAQQIGAGVASLFGATEIADSLQSRSDAVLFAKNSFYVSSTPGGGGLASLFSYGPSFRLTGRYQHVILPPLEEYGRPCFIYSSVAANPGFIQCGDAHIETYGTPQENAAVLSYMNGGFYYE